MVEHQQPITDCFLTGYIKKGYAPIQRCICGHQTEVSEQKSWLSGSIFYWTAMLTVQPI